LAFEWEHKQQMVVVKVKLVCAIKIGYLQAKAKPKQYNDDVKRPIASKPIELGFN